MIPAEYSKVLSSDDIFCGEDLCLSFDFLIDPCFLLEYIIDGTYVEFLYRCCMVVSVCAFNFQVLRAFFSAASGSLARKAHYCDNRYHEGYLIFNVHQPL